MTVEDFCITDSEHEAIDQLKKNMTCDLDEKQSEDTFLFYRFLKTKDFDVPRAEDLLRKFLLWRKQMNMDKIVTEYKPPKVLTEFIPKLKVCYSKDGHTIFYAPVGTFDIKGLILSAKYSDIEKASFQTLEKELITMKEKCQKVAGWFPGIMLIYNMDGLSFAQATDKKALEYFIRFVKTFQVNYPEVLAKVYVINASTYFAFMFNILRPVLAQSILGKIHVYSKEGWQEDLVQHADPNDLPAFLGGKKTDPDGNPLCESFICHGGPIPTKYHIHKSKQSLANQPGVQKLVLSRAAFSEIKVEVEVPGSILEWEFETKTRDIGFGLFRKEGEGDSEKVTELVPLQRLEADNFAETGIYKCEMAATYVMLFDNSYSWIRSKEIYYTMKIIPPEDQEY